MVCQFGALLNGVDTIGAQGGSNSRLFRVEQINRGTLGDLLVVLHEVVPLTSPNVLVLLSGRAVNHIEAFAWGCNLDIGLVLVNHTASFLAGPDIVNSAGIEY